MIVLLIIIGIACIFADEWQKNENLREWVNNIKNNG